MLTPFFEAFRPQLGPMRRAARTLPPTALPQLQLLFESFLPLHFFSPSDDGPNSRERLFSLRRTFFAFLWQVLNPGAPCREALRQLQAEAQLQGEKIGSESTAAYCQARRRLPTELLERILRHTAQLAGQRVPDGQFWFGREVKLADGTTVSMPDTPENQELYPQSSTQKPGCGFPLMRLVGIFSLASGALLDFAKRSHFSHDIHLFEELRQAF